MHIAYTPEQEELRRELRAYFAGLMTSEVREALSGGEDDYGSGQAYRSVVRRLGQDGWLAMGWPAEHGGRGGTTLDQLIFTDEAAIARVPVIIVPVDSPGAVLAGRIGRAHRAALILTFGGGTNEVQRDIIAAAGLGLPLSRR